MTVMIVFIYNISVVQISVICENIYVQYILRSITKLNTTHTILYTHLPNNPDARNLSRANIACPVTGPVVSSLTTISQNGRTTSSRLTTKINRKRAKQFIN